MHPIRFSSIILGLFVAAELIASAGCLGRPIVECTGSASYPCPDNTCAISPNACAAEPGCPADFPARCDEHYCAVDYSKCPASGTVPGQTDPVVAAPAPTDLAASVIE